MYSTLLLDYNKECATITLNRPDKRNAINPAMIADLQTALDEIEKKKMRVVILAAAGSVFFSCIGLGMIPPIALQSAPANQEGSPRLAQHLRRNLRVSRPH